MSLPWILVSPASRGIGAALTTHLLRTTSLPILATTRASDPSTTKKALLSAAGLGENGASSRDEERLHVVPLDVTKESTVPDAASYAHSIFPSRSHHLRLALAIPGILHAEKNPSQVDYDKSLEQFKVNALGPLLLMKHFVEFLPRKATTLDDAAPSSPSSHSSFTLAPYAVWLSMSARVGSTSDNRAGGWYSYRASKAAVTSLCKSLDIYLRHRSGDKAMAVAFHPGTVRTALSEPFWESVPDGKLFEPSYAAERLLGVVTEGVGLEGRGRCWDWKGEEVLP